MFDYYKVNSIVVYVIIFIMIYIVLVKVLLFIETMCLGFLMNV